MTHIKAKKATLKAEGNAEYWYCESCNKYFSDKDGENEITLKDTVIEKLKETNKPEKNEKTSPKTGDLNNNSVWLIILFIGGAVLTVVSAFGKSKKNRFNQR